MNISKFFNQKYGKGDFSIVEDKLVYETNKGDIIEANLPEQANKFIKNDMENEEVEMTKKQENKEDKKEDLNDQNMGVKYVKMTETHNEPDPETIEAARKHVDMDASGKEKKIPEDGEEAGEMAAETPQVKKKKGDFDEILKRFDMFEQKLAEKDKAIEKLSKQVNDLNAEKIAEKTQITNDLVEGMSNKYMVPSAWTTKTSEKYGDLKADFIQDLYEGLSFAFGTLPEHVVEGYKEDMKDNGLLSKVEGL